MNKQQVVSLSLDFLNSSNIRPTEVEHATALYETVYIEPIAPRTSESNVIMLQFSTFADAQASASYINALKGGDAGFGVPDAKPVKPEIFELGV